MRIIIAGGRKIWDYEFVRQTIDYYTQNIGYDWTLVCGMAPGVDTVAHNICEYRGIPIDKYPANWDVHGNSAGPMRNREMAENADSLIAIWDGKSTGTADMINVANKLGLKVRVVIYDK